MSSVGICVCLMSSGHTLYPLGNTVFPCEVVTKFLDHSTVTWAAVVHAVSPPWALWRFFPHCCSHDLPPWKLTSYFNDLYSKIKEIYISSLNLNWLLKFKENFRHRTKYPSLLENVKLLCPWKHSRMQSYLFPSSGAISYVLLLVLTFSLPSSTQRCLQEGKSIDTWSWY